MGDRGRQSRPAGSAFSRAEIRALRDGLAATLSGQPATALSGEAFEQAFRPAFGCVEIKSRPRGLFDAWPADGGTAWQLKTLVADERLARAQLWPAALGKRRLVMPGELDPDNTEPVSVEIQVARVNPRLNTLFRLVESDPATAGAWLLRHLAEYAARWTATRAVTEARLGLLLRHPDGRHLAYTETPLAPALLLDGEIRWHWQEVPVSADDELLDEGAATVGERIEMEKTALNAFDPAGRLLAHYYPRGGQLRARLLLDPRAIARFTI
jgi:hypothetical protein